MTLRECYTALGADFEETLGRLCSEKLVEKFALKFLADESFTALEKAMSEENYEDAFRGAHTLKGISLNLGFTRLYQVSNELSEALRGGRKPEDDSLYEKVKIEYQRTITLLRELQDAKSSGEGT